MQTKADTSAVTEPVVQVTGLTRRFKRTAALDNLTLSVPKGQVFGLVGANGAGKTTLIKHILGLFSAQAGSVRVFGLDPVTEPEAVLGRIGFLSEDRDLPYWMRLEELLAYTAAFYPAWDHQYAEALGRQFQLDPTAKLRQLSRGELAKAGLLLALAHRPELLLLDEPSSGLDPIVRREILEAIVRSVADEGRTVIFSSHLLDEIERVSDRVAMLSGGRLVLEGAVHEILESHRRITFRFPAAQLKAPLLSKALSLVGSDREWTAVCNGTLEEVITEARVLGGQVVADEPATFEEIFVARASRAGQGTQATSATSVAS